MAAAQAAELAAKAKAEQESQQAALAAEQAREQLRAQAVAERGQKITAKLKELGFQVISPIDLELDWRDLIKNGEKVALWGNYARVDYVDALLVDHKDQAVIRLYTDGASRYARKAMLECRDAGTTDCRMVIGAPCGPASSTRARLLISVLISPGWGAERPGRNRADPWNG